MTNFSKSDFKHHSKRRKRGHDYKAPWKYHITINKSQAAPDFSAITINTLTPEGVTTALSTLGEIIEKGITDISSHNPKLEVLEHIVMPDHIHILIRVKSYLKKALGTDIGAFKAGIANKWRLLTDNKEAEVFEWGFNDKIIFPHRNLENVRKYIQQNPYRLAVRRTHPEFFRKQRLLLITGREVQAYGNLFLLRNPFKQSLVVHRKDDEKVFTSKLEECLDLSMNGGVVVSAFISPREKEIRKLIELCRGRIIQIHNRPFGEREKPEKRNFDLCCEGKLLLIAPTDYSEKPQSEHPSRQQCLDMNNLAETIAEIDF